MNYEVVKEVRNALTLRSSNLDQTSRRMLHEIISSFKQFIFDEASEAKKTVPLMEWLPTELTMAVTFAIYEIMGLFQVKNVQNGFWYVS